MSSPPTHSATKSLNVALLPNHSCYFSFFSFLCSSCNNPVALPLCPKPNSLCLSPTQPFSFHSAPAWCSWARITCSSAEVAPAYYTAWWGKTRVSCICSVPNLPSLSSIFIHRGWGWDADREAPAHTQRCLFALPLSNPVKEQRTDTSFLGTRRSWKESGLYLWDAFDLAWNLAVRSWNYKKKV